jgi:hypothetical protein
VEGPGPSDLPGHRPAEPQLRRLRPVRLGRPDRRQAGRRFLRRLVPGGRHGLQLLRQQSRGARRADLAHPAERQGRRRVRRGPPVRHRPGGRGGWRDVGPGRARLHQFRRAGRQHDLRPTTGSRRASVCCGRTRQATSSSPT